MLALDLNLVLLFLSIFMFANDIKRNLLSCVLLYVM